MNTKKIAVTASLLISAASLEAYTIESAHWNPGTVSFYVDLGSFNNVAAHELSVWDQYTGATHLRTTNNSATNGGVWFQDGRNSIEWASAVDWTLPGNILGVCSFNSYTGNGITDEADILINPYYDWAGGYYDIGAVLLHEIGHAIGLGHSQVGGIMSPYIYPGELPALSADDIAGARFLYGPGSRSVPDGGSTAVLLGLGIGLLAICKRRKTGHWIYEQ